MFPVLFSLGPVVLYTFGLFALAAFFFASFVVWKRGREGNFSEDELFDSIILVTLVGLAGARLFFVVGHFERFGLSPLRWISFLGVPGLTILGGLIGGGLALWAVCRRKRWPFFSVSDIAVTGLSLGQAIGWVGAFFSGFGVGKIVARFGLVFPGDTVRRFPAQLLLAAAYLVAFLFLWRVEQRYRTFEWYRGKRAAAETGFLTFSYLTFLGLLGLLRGFIADETLYWLGFPAGVVLSLVLLVGGVIGLYWRSGRVFDEDYQRLVGFFGGGGRKGMVWMNQRLRRARRRLKKTEVPYEE